MRRLSTGEDHHKEPSGSATGPRRSVFGIGHTRRTGGEQMTTDTALGVTKIVVVDKSTSALSRDLGPRVDRSFQRLLTKYLTS